MGLMGLMGFMSLFDLWGWQFDEVADDAPCHCQTEEDEGGPGRDVPLP